jgi:hypothetical protein
MGAMRLATALKDNQSLRFLSLFNNQIGFDGAKSIAENILKKHPKLECL